MTTKDERKKRSNTCYETIKDNECPVRHYLFVERDQLNGCFNYLTLYICGNVYTVPRTHYQRKITKTTTKLDVY